MVVKYTVSLHLLWEAISKVGLTIPGSRSVAYRDKVPQNNAASHNHEIIVKVVKLSSML